MKIIISESRVSKLIANYIEMTYGELNQVYDKEDNTIMWFLKDEDPKKNYPLFELNGSGTLFVPHEFNRRIGDLFGFDYKREVDKAIAECWEYMFHLYPQRINIYF